MSTIAEHLVRLLGHGRFTERELILGTEIAAMDEAIAGVREALSEFMSEDVEVMAQRARDTIERLRSMEIPNEQAGETRGAQVR